MIDWYGGTLVSRLNDKETGSIIGVMQRLHEEDLAGHLREQGGWDCLELPAIALDDEVIPLGHGLTHCRRAGDILHPASAKAAGVGGDQGRNWQLVVFRVLNISKGRPRLGATMIKRNWVRRYIERPRREDVLQIIQSLGHRHGRAGPG